LSGGNQASSGAYYGFLYSGGSYTTLSDPLAVGSAEPLTMALGTNDAGEIVGLYRGADNHIHGFLYKAGTYTTIDDPLGVKTEAYAINKGGQIERLRQCLAVAFAGCRSVAQRRDFSPARRSAPTRQGIKRTIPPWRHQPQRRAGGECGSLC
jgi:hypothetical protein